MSNVDPVNDVVQHVDDLCDDRWNGKLKEEFSDRFWTFFPSETIGAAASVSFRWIVLRSVP